ncbi:MAG: hypothetical protein MK207_01365 [Saprospiraceae bacterium]|nr:hypothetical protein [Saprospiraceae bacterium]
MYIKLTSFLLLITIVGFFSCDDKNSKIPSIEFVSVSKSYLAQNGADSSYLKFLFTDGDGNIGSDTADNIFVKDSRTGTNIASYKIPNYLGNNSSNSSRSGEVTIIVYSQCCIYPDTTSCYSSTMYPTGIMKYEVQIKDQEGNYSNIIESNEITLDCN